MIIKIKPSLKLQQREFERDMLQPFTKSGGINLKYVKQYGISYLLKKGLTKDQIFNNIDKKI